MTPDILIAPGPKVPTHLHASHGRQPALKRYAPTPPPTATIIVPVRNDPHNLRLCLQSILRSEFRNFEVLVVDDASTDHSAEVAQSMGVNVSRLSKRLGPAAARNRGAHLAQGEYLIFIDADCTVSPTTLGRLVETFRRDSSVDAVFGSYDASPSALNILSQYRNLLHHFTHQESNEEATTFWSGCGAIKRRVFHDLGGFSFDFDRPCIEDIEFGARLRHANKRVLLNKQAQVCHLKRWNMLNMIKTDVLDRAVPWTHLILREKSIPNDLNLKTANRVSTILAFLLLMMLVVGAFYLNWIALAIVAAVVGLMAIDHWSQSRRVPDWVRVGGAGALAGVAGAAIYQWPSWSAVVAVLLTAITILNWRFYAFLVREKNLLFTLTVMPVHIMYYLYCGVGFATGVLSYLWNERFTTAGSTQRASARAASESAVII